MRKDFATHQHWAGSKHKRHYIALGGSDLLRLRTYPYFRCWRTKCKAEFSSGIQVLGGVIDSDYRGEIRIMLTGPEYHISRGDRVAQLIIEKVEMLEPVWDEELEETTRGVAGFGSTGV